MTTSVPDLRAKILMVGASAIVTLFACEAFLTWDPLDLRGPYPPKGFDQREYVDVVRDLRATGVSAYHVFAVFNWIASPPEVQGTRTVPLAGVPHATTVMCNEAGTYVTYESDRFGFNNPDRQWDMLPSSKWPQVVLTFAVCVVSETALIFVLPQMQLTLIRQLQGLIALVLLTLLAVLVARVVRAIPSVDWWTTLLGQASFPFFITHDLVDDEEAKRCVALCVHLHRSCRDLDRGCQCGVGRTILRKFLRSFAGWYKRDRPGAALANPPHSHFVQQHASAVDACSGCGTWPRHQSRTRRGVDI